MRRMVLALSLILLACLVAWRLTSGRRPARSPSTPLASEVEAQPARVEHGVELEAAPGNAASQQRAVAVIPTDPHDVTVAGIVIDEDENPVADARVSLDAIEIATFSGVKATRHSLFQPIDTVNTDANGRFECHGRSHGVTLNLHASHADFADRAWMEVKAGTRDARLVLHRGGALEMRIVFPGETILSGLRVELDAELDPEHPTLNVSTSTRWFITGNGVDVGEDLEGGIRVIASESTPPALSVLVPKLAAANWTVRLSSTVDSATLAQVDHVRVEDQRTTRDARLWPVDLRDVLAGVHFTIADPAGALVPAGYVRWGDASKQVGSARLQFSDGELRFFVRTGTDIEIGATGFCTAHVKAVDGPRTIVLSRGMPVRFVLDGARVPDKPACLRLALVKQPVPPDQASYLVIDTHGDSAERIARLASRSTLHWYQAAEFDASGEAAMIIGEPGAYYACWYLAQPLEGTRRLQARLLSESEPQRVVVPDKAGDEPVRVHLDPSLVWNALQH